MYLTCFPLPNLSTSPLHRNMNWSVSSFLLMPCFLADIWLTLRYCVNSCPLSVVSTIVQYIYIYPVVYVSTPSLLSLLCTRPIVAHYFVLHFLYVWKNLIKIVFGKKFLYFVYINLIVLVTQNINRTCHQVFNNCNFLSKTFPSKKDTGTSLHFWSEYWKYGHLVDWEFKVKCSRCDIMSLKASWV